MFHLIFLSWNEQMFLCLFILRTRGSACVCSGGRHRGRESKGERKRILSRIHAVSAEPNGRLELMKHEIMTWAKIKCRMLKQPSHPGAFILIFKKAFLIASQDCKLQGEGRYSVLGVSIWHLSWHHLGQDREERLDKIQMGRLSIRQYRPSKGY